MSILIGKGRNEAVHIVGIEKTCQDIVYIN